MAIGDLVKSTLGPKGMDKILWGMGRNDGIVEVSIFLIFYIMTTIEEQQFKPFNNWFDILTFDLILHFCTASNIFFVGSLMCTDKSLLLQYL